MLTTQITRQLPILLLISFDGFRQDYLNSNLTPNLYDLSKSATLGNMESLYITKTFPNHFSMVTGIYEDEHEIINNKMYDPNLNETFKPGVSSINWWNPKGKTTPIWTANQLYGYEMGEKRFSASMMFPGSTTPFADILPTHLKDFNTIRNWTDNVETVISWLTDEEKPSNFVSIYFDDPDSTAHSHGPWGKATLESIRRVDSAAGYLVKRLRDVDLADKTNILFVSDHGMAEVKDLIYLSDFIDTEPFDLYGNTPDWSVFVKPNHQHEKNKIFLELVRISKRAHFRIYKREDIPPEYHYSKSERIGDFFILVDQKYDMYENRSKNQTKTYLSKIWGNHGWKPTDSDMRPFFMAYGPSFKRGFKHRETFPNLDVFPLMVFLLGLPSEKLPNNGSLARIIDVIDISHFGDENGALERVTILVLLGLLFTLFARGNRTNFRPDSDLDELAPGLNIDLSYYIKDESLEKKKNRRKREEMLSLLSS